MEVQFHGTGRVLDTGIGDEEGEGGEMRWFEVFLFSDD